MLYKSVKTHTLTLMCAAPRGNVSQSINFRRVRWYAEHKTADFEPVKIFNESIHTWLHLHRDYYPYPFPPTLPIPCTKPPTLPYIPNTQPHPPYTTHSPLPYATHLPIPYTTHPSQPYNTHPPPPYTTHLPLLHNTHPPTPILYHPPTTTLHMVGVGRRVKNLVQSKYFSQTKLQSLSTLETAVPVDNDI